MSKVMGAARSWARDMGFGIRLAVGGGRTPWGRLTLTVIGIGLGVAVLLLASSVQNMIEAREHREYAREVNNLWASDEIPAPGQATILAADLNTTFRGQPISGMALDEQRPGAPVPPGTPRLPRPGELIVSPALEQLLNGPDGSLLRPRLSGKVVGTIGEEGLSAPRELYYYTGIDGLSVEASQVKWVGDHFGQNGKETQSLDRDLWFLLSLGVTAFLVPVVVFVAGTTRLAEAARQRRLAALRLVGASRKQVRRIASGEALMGAVLGVVAGWAVFFLGRLLAGQITVAGFSVFSHDIWPEWWYAGLVSLLIPIIAVVTAVVVLRSTVAEPLRVVRQTPPSRRRLVWRCVPIVVGALGILAVGRLNPSASDTSAVFTGSVVLLLIGVPLLLPWIVERVIGRLRGGALPWQLAVRRLQLTSGTAARSVSAIAVVLTGVIGLQTVLATIEASRLEHDRAPATKTRVEITGSSSAPERDDGVAAASQALSAVPGASNVEGVSVAYLEAVDGTGHAVTIADCPTLVRITGAPQCRDGDAFYAGRAEEVDGTERPDPIREGSEWHLTPYLYGPPGSNPISAHRISWRVPEGLQPLDTPQVRDRQFGHSSLLVTPRAAEGIPPWARSIRVELDLAPGSSPESLELVRNAAAGTMAVSSVSQQYSASQDEASLALIRYGLLLGALVTFALIGCSLFVSAAEQIQEQRRPMAVLAAVGVRRTTMGWSALLQNWVLMLAATAVSVLIGLLLGVLVVVSISVDDLSFDFAGLLGLLGIAALSVLVVTALTLPALARAMHPDGLRTE